MIKLKKYRTHFEYNSRDDKELRYFEKNMRVFIEGAVYSQKYKDRVWDGYINFCNVREMTFPVGMLQEAKEVFELGEIEYVIENHVPSYTPTIPFTEKMYEHQKTAILEFFKNFHGIIQVPTRGGKTILVAETVRLLTPEFPDLKTLFVVDTQMLLDQAVSDCAEFWDIPESEIGIIQGNVFKPKNFTVTTIQTLQSRLVGVMDKLKKEEKKFGFKELKEKRKEVKQSRNKYLDYFQSVEFLVVDECHEYSSKKRIDLLKRFKNLYMDLFISATPFKSENIDGNRMLRMFAGDVIYKIEDKTLKERGILARDKIFLFDIDHNDNKNIIATTYSEYHTKIITHNPLRNQILLNTIEILRKLDLKTLVLFSEIKHGKYIQSITGDPFIYGSMKIKDRRQFTNEFLRRKGSVLLASDVFKKGITLPEVQVTVNAAGGLEQSQVIQKRGRGLGVKNEKIKALTIDFIDNFNKYFFEHSLSRIQAYEEKVGIENIEVFEVSDNDMYSDLRDMLIGWFEIIK